jgi:hypothetical protein
MSNVMDWLLEQEPGNPGVRYFALTNLLERPQDDPEVIAAQRAVMEQGPVPAILAAQNPGGLLSQISRHRLVDHLPGPTGCSGERCACAGWR